MKKFRLSLAFALLLLATTPFQGQLRSALLRAGGFRFTSYLLLALLAAFFLVAFLRAAAAGRMPETAAVLLAAAVVAYLLFGQRVFLNPLAFAGFLRLAGFLALGLLLARENKRASSPVPFLILLATALAFELAQALFLGRVVDADNLWTNAIAGLAGLAAGGF